MDKLNYIEDKIALSHYLIELLTTKMPEIKTREGLDLSLEISKRLREVTSVINDANKRDDRKDLLTADLGELFKGLNIE